MEDSGRGPPHRFPFRKDTFFSDGTPFSAEDVAYTVRRLMDPALHSPVGDAFRSADGKPETAVRDPYSIVITFPAPVAALERLFDQVAILSARSPQKEKASLGPFTFAEHKPGHTSFCDATRTIGRRTRAVGGFRI